MTAGAGVEPGKRVRGKRPPEGEPVIDRALALFAAFDAGHRRLALHELSRRSGIPVSSTLRMAGRLLAWGALERDEEGRYSIGLRLLEVASLAPRGHGLREVALPYMSDLAAVTKQHVQLAVREGLEVTLVERFSSHSAIPVLYRVGGKMPLHCTGMGLALLAFAVGCALVAVALDGPGMVGLVLGPCVAAPFLFARRRVILLPSGAAPIAAPARLAVRARVWVS